MTGVCGNSAFSFIRDCQTIFRSAWILTDRYGSFWCSTSSQAFGGVSVPDSGHSNGTGVPLLIFMSLLTQDVEHLFLCLFATCTSFLLRVLLKFCSIFKQG